MSKQPPPAPTASAVGPCPTVIKIVGRPGTGSLHSTIAPPDHSLCPGQTLNKSHHKGELHHQKCKGYLRPTTRTHHTSGSHREDPQPIPMQSPLHKVQQMPGPRAQHKQLPKYTHNTCPHCAGPHSYGECMSKGNPRSRQCGNCKGSHGAAYKLPCLHHT